MSQENEIQCTGLLEKLQTSVVLYSKLSLEDLKEAVAEMEKAPPKVQDIMLPAAYLLMIPDDEFIAICKSKSKQKFGMCGSEMNRKIQERFDKLITNGK